MGRKHLYPPSVRHGIPRLGKPPRGWTKTTFGEQLQVVERPVEIQPDATYQLVTAKRNRGGIVARETLRGDQILTAGQFRVEAGDFITSNRQIIHGACGIVPPELDGAIVSGEYTVLIARNGLHLPFFAHYTHTDYFQKTCFLASVGVDVEKMIFNVEAWLKLPFHLPPWGEQLTISKTLDDVDRSVEKSLSVQKHLRDIRRKLLNRTIMLGTSKKPELGAPFGVANWRFPKSWKLSQLSEVSQIFSGVTLGRELNGAELIEVPYIRVANVQDGKLDLSEVKMISIRREELARFQLMPGDVLMNEGGATDSVGRGTVWNGEISRCIHQNHVFRISADRTRLKPEFLALLAESNYGRRFFSDNAKQTTIAFINSSLLSQFIVPLPSIEEQRRIVEHVDHWTAAIAAEERKLAALERVKAELARRLLTGELRVKP